MNEEKEGKEGNILKEKKPTKNTQDIHDRPTQPTLGVKQIWVHTGYRRNNIAKHLLDTARKHFLFGTYIMSTHVVFSQPTDDGLKFALGYTNQENIWAYA